MSAKFIFAVLINYVVGTQIIKKQNPKIMRARGFNKMFEKYQILKKILQF